jgi:predicted dehydrogenase
MIPVAVVGVGSMGQNHVRVLMDLPDVELVGIADCNLDATRNIARKYNLPAFADHASLFDARKPAAVIIAAPTHAHFEIAMDALARGIHVLVEKPIASTLVQAEAMIARAQQMKVCLSVGHIERFNPAVIELKRRIDRGELGKVFMLHARRQSPFPGRIRDVGVANDLATHELDMMRYLTGSRVAQMSAQVSQVLAHDTREDIVFGLLRFANGVLGVLDVNWVTPTSVRELSITGERGMFVVNYLSQELLFYENPAALAPLEGTVWDFTVQAGNQIRFQIARREPLRSELESFIHAIQNGAPPVVRGEDGLEALRLALQIVELGKAKTDED